MTKPRKRKRKIADREGRMRYREGNRHPRGVVEAPSGWGPR